MKTHSNTAPRNAQAPSYPPLARDGHGNPQAIPDGAAGWCLKRETGGRPKTIVGADRQPARFPLDVTADDIEAMVGAGTYRVYAVGADGEVLDYVTTISVGDAALAEPDPAPASVGLPRSATSDLRFALETILQMSRAQSDSLKAVVLAQADWVKGLATAKALPRNGYPMTAPPATYRVLDEPANDEADEDEDGDEPASAPVTPPWLEAVNAVAPVVQTYGELLKQKFAPPTPAMPEVTRNAAPEPPAEGTAPATAPPNPMIHLSEINARLTSFERKFINVVLRGRQGGELANMLLTMSVDEAASFVKEQIARVQAERDASVQGGAAPPADPPIGDSPPRRFAAGGFVTRRYELGPRDIERLARLHLARARRKRVSDGPGASDGAVAGAALPGRPARGAEGEAAPDDASRRGDVDPGEPGGAARRGLGVKRPTLQLAEVVGEILPAGDPANDEAVQTASADLVQWIDAIALAIAAGVRVGERGMLRAAAGATDRADAALTPGHDPEVMGADEVAAFLGVDRNTVYDYAGRGEIPHRRLGKRLLFSRSAIVSWLGSCKAASARKG